jgi:hypothetical protein
MNPFTVSVVNRLTKGVVIASTLAAAFVQLYLATRLLYPQLFFIVTAAFVVAIGIGSWRPGPAMAVVLAASYLAPAAYVIWAGFENYSFEIVWSLPLLGLILSGRDGWRWHLPTSWRWPLVAWSPRRGRSCSCARSTSTSASCHCGAWRTPASASRRGMR